ncbi:MAG: hypothetical protein J5832_02265 [Clostridia bacterium]|nr:hypothetical protein [Clostridia bacterium]
MPEFPESESVFAIAKNLSASNTECSAALEKRLSHLCDMAAVTKNRLRDALGRSPVLKAALTSDEARLIINEMISSVPEISENGGAALERPIARSLKTHDLCVFSRALAGGEKYGLSEISDMVFGGADDVPRSAEKKVALLKNAQASRAFELFAANLHGAMAIYEDNFQSACEAVYEKDTQYAVIPVSSNADGRLDGLYRMMEKYGLAVCMTCRVSLPDGSSTCFALAGRPTAHVISGGRAKFEFKITLDDISELAEISEAAEFFGAALEKADAIPSLYGRDNTFGVVIDIEDADTAGLLVYTALRFSQFVPIGIYSHITEE